MAHQTEVQPDSRTLTRQQIQINSFFFCTNVIVQISGPVSADRLRGLADMPAVGIKSARTLDDHFSIRQ